MGNLLKRSLLFNSLLALIIFGALIMILFSSLSVITKHGQDAKVPMVIGHKLPLAKKELNGFELQIDSVYMPYKDPLEVIFQEPQAGNIVKKGRVIFLTVNKQSPPTIAMPNLVNMSFRNATFTLQTFRLIMGDTIYKPDIAAGAVLEQQYKGKTITAGTLIPIGSRINLVVGSGLSDSTINVPNLVGMTYANAKATLAAIGISFNAVWEGTITDSNNAIIYNQAPESINDLDFVNTITAGDMIDCRIMQKPSAELLRINQPGSKKFVNPSDSAAPEASAIVPAAAQATPKDEDRPKVIPGMYKQKTIHDQDNDKSTNDKTLAPKHHTSKPKHTSSPKGNNEAKSTPVQKQDNGYKDEFK